MTLSYHATEHQHQVALFAWAGVMQAKRPLLALLYAIPNAARRSVRNGAEMKREGLRPGMPDICLPVGIGKWSALYLELKAPNGRLSDRQRERLRLLYVAGNAAWVAIGWEMAAELIEKYMDGELQDGAGGW